MAEKSKQLTTEQVSQHFASMVKDKGYTSAGRQPKTAGEKEIATSFMSTRSEFDLNDYYNARPNEYISTDINQIMAQCENFYNKTGILRSIVDFISEFVIDGIEILHTDKETQSFYQTWANSVGLKNRSERFVNNLTKSGNVIVRRYSDQLTVNQKNAMTNEKIIAKKQKVGHNTVPDKENRTVPTRYEFYRPSSVELVGGYAGALSNKKIYGIKIPTEFLMNLRSANTPLEKKVLDSLPKDILESLDKNVGSFITYPLPADDIYVAHYKKDDSDIWAYPIIYSVLADIILNAKTKMAKSAALDGWINSVALWKLGDHKEGYLPTPGSAQKLREIVETNTGGGKKDIIWDSMIAYEEFYPPIEKFNNIVENNVPILVAFGIPEELSGGPLNGSGSGNYALRLKNFAKKLSAFRRELINWINFEIGIIHRNMKFDTAVPTLRFKNDDLMDEKVYYTILRELWDRNILSDQTMLERIEELPEIEKARVQEENEAREKGTLPEKASPFHNPNLTVQNEFELKRDKINNAHNEAIKVPTTNKNGRPSGAKDKMPRTRKSPTKAEIVAYAAEAYDSVEDFLLPLYLKQTGAANFRALTADQKEKFEDCRLSAMVNLEPNTELTTENIIIACKVNPDILDPFLNIYRDYVKDIPKERANVKTLKMLKIQSYTDLWGID